MPLSSTFTDLASRPVSPCTPGAAGFVSISVAEPAGLRVKRQARPAITGDEVLAIAIEWLLRHCDVLFVPPAWATAAQVASERGRGLASQVRHASLD